MLELIDRVNWDEYLLILSQGDPPISLQLVVLNAMLVGYWLLRRTAKRTSQKGSQQGAGLILPALFIAANFGVVMLGSRLSF